VDYGIENLKLKAELNFGSKNDSEYTKTVRFKHRDQTKNHWWRWLQSLLFLEWKHQRSRSQNYQMQKYIACNKITGNVYLYQISAVLAVSLYSISAVLRHSQRDFLSRSASQSPGLQESTHCFHARCRKRQPNLASGFFLFIVCYIVFVLTGECLLLLC